jgi:hypothetical protein
MLGRFKFTSQKILLLAMSLSYNHFCEHKLNDLSTIVFTVAFHLTLFVYEVTGERTGETYSVRDQNDLWFSQKGYTAYTFHIPTRENYKNNYHGHKNTPKQKEGTK